MGAAMARDDLRPAFGKEMKTVHLEVRVSTVDDDMPEHVVAEAVKSAVLSAIQPPELWQVQDVVWARSQVIPCSSDKETV